MSETPAGEHSVDEDALMETMRAALEHRARTGIHLHHSACIHNLPPVEQVELRGKTVEWWTQFVGPLPVQITPDQWECEPPGPRPIPPAETAEGSSDV